uniref:FHA domain-containing protein n=1 Tax=Tetraselmis sp. GSL018 TaxID=582737 RepID=A0A061RQD2_9CHLO
MVWVLSETSPEGRTHILLAGKYSIGRKDADIVLEDKSISRKHAEICVAVSEFEGVNTNVPRVHITSFGQFGTFCKALEGQNFKALQKGVVSELGNGFGRVKELSLRHQELVLFVSGSVDTQLQEKAAAAGIQTSAAWDGRATHILIEDALSEAGAAATICGHLGGQPVVSGRWYRT